MGGWGTNPPPATIAIIENKQVKREPEIGSLRFRPNCPCCVRVSHWMVADGRAMTRSGDVQDLCCMRSKAETFSP
jgi:hypothetical protein